MFRNFLETKNRYTFQTLGLVGPLGVCLGAEWRIFGALIVELFFFHARFPVWVKSFIASTDYCVLKKTFKKHRSENILLDLGHKS